MKIHSTYQGASGRESTFDLTLSPLRKNGDLVIFCHGYKGFKDWGVWNLVAEKFANQGLDFLKFNFSHNGGTVENPIDFPDEQAFAENSYSKELEDIGHIWELVKNGIAIDGECRKYRSVHLIGHSRGGGVAVLAVVKYGSFKTLTTWSAVADFGERFNFDMEKWKETGITHIKNARTGQMLPHNYSYYQDYLANQHALDILTAAKKVSIPWLIAHGDRDEAVSFDNAERLNSAMDSSKLLPVLHTGHTFGASHPWRKKELPQALNGLCEKTIEFIKAY